VQVHADVVKNAERRLASGGGGSPKRPGGAKPPMKLYLLNLGRCEVDKGRVLTPGSDDGVRITIPVVAYLIETDAGQRILVDSGMNRKQVADSGTTVRTRSARRYVTPIMTARDDIRHRLNEINVTVRDVDILISTHFHFDHAGNHADFGHARIVAQREAYEYAKANPLRCPPDAWDLSQLSYELIEDDQEIAAGISLVETSGHVPGHMSVVVRLPRAGTFVLAIDAIATRENLERDNWAAHVDPDRGRASARKLAAIAQRERGVLITGHDAAEWAHLMHAPDYYE
jgi:N-acyl homoserine lactone hydrolase